MSVIVYYCGIIVDAVMLVGLLQSKIYSIVAATELLGITVEGYSVKEAITVISYVWPIKD